MKAIYVVAVAIAAIFIGTASAGITPLKAFGGFADFGTTITDATSAHTGNVPASAWAWQTGAAEADSLITASNIKAGYTDTDSGFALNAVNKFKADPLAQASDFSDSISATTSTATGFSINPDGTLHGAQSVDEGAAATTSCGLTGWGVTAQGIKKAEVLVAGTSQTDVEEALGTSNSQSESFGGAEADW